MYRITITTVVVCSLFVARAYSSNVAAPQAVDDNVFLENTAEVDLFAKAAAKFGLGPELFINPILEGILGPTVQDLMQKLGNFAASSITPRLAGFLTGKGDTNRPVMLLWLIQDSIEQLKRQLDLARGVVAALKQQAEQRKAAALLAAETAKQAALNAKTRAAAQAELLKAAANMQGKATIAKLTGGAPDSLGVGEESPADSPTDHNADDPAPVETKNPPQDQENPPHVNPPVQDANDHLAYLRAAARDGIAAAQARDATAKAAQAASAAQIAAQSPSIPPLEKENFAAVAAQAAVVAETAKLIAKQAHEATLVSASAAAAIAHTTISGLTSNGLIAPAAATTGFVVENPNEMDSLEDDVVAVNMLEIQQIRDSVLSILLELHDTIGGSVVPRIARRYGMLLPVNDAIFLEEDPVTLVGGRRGVFQAASMLAKASEGLTERFSTQMPSDASFVELNPQQKPVKHAAYMESTARYQGLGATSKRLVDSLVHPFTSSLFTDVTDRLSAAISDALFERLRGRLTNILPGNIARATGRTLAPVLQSALGSILPAALGRALPPAIIPELSKQLREGLLATVTHSVVQTVAASLIHRTVGLTTSECQVCLHALGGAATVMGAEEADFAAWNAGACDAACWGDAVTHEQAASLAKLAHTAAAYFIDSYVVNTTFRGR